MLNARNGQGSCLTMEKLQRSQASKGSRLKWRGQQGESVCVWVCVCGGGVPLQPPHRALANLDKERPCSPEQLGGSSLEQYMVCHVRRPRCQEGDILSFKEAGVQKGQQ